MINMNTNLSSLITQRSLAKSTLRLNQAIEQMTTGFKINHAKDNAANYNITTNMTTKIGAYMVAEDNCAMGLDLLATANGSLDQIADKLQRLRALAVQFNNGTYGEQSKEAINQEANMLVDEIERIYNTTEYNGINVIKGRVSKIEEGKFLKDIDRRDTSSMTTLASVDETVEITSGTYSISTPEELAKLATMTNNGLIRGHAPEFVLAADIDLSDYSTGEGWVPIGTIASGNKFYAKFDGNGYKVSNLYINRPYMDYQGLFGYVVSKGGVSNLAIENCNINARSLVGAIAGEFSYGYLTNCYSTGEVSASSIYVGGLTGFSKDTIVEEAYSDCEITGSSAHVGGLIGYVSSSPSFESQLIKCYSFSNVSGSSSVGGAIGGVGGNVAIKECYVLGELSGYYKGSFVGESRYTSNISIQNCFYNKDYQNIGINLLSNACYYSNFEENNNVSIEVSDLNSFVSHNSTHNSSYDFQIGVNATTSSSISFGIGMDLGEMWILKKLGLSNDFNSLNIIDNLMNLISDKQIQLGSSQNRLESALEEISVQYETLVSSRSTLRDADISEVSSEYIRQQILQQASATLMATANQSPSIALQLI